MRYRSLRPALEFEDLIRSIIGDLKLGNVTPEEEMRASDAGADIEFSNAAGLHLVECKIPGPQTSHRVRVTIEQLTAMSGVVKRRTGRSSRMILATPANLSKDTFNVFAAAGIEVWDRQWLAKNAAKVGRQSQAAQFLGDPESTPSEPVEHRSDELLARLSGIAPGPDWHNYQKLCQEIAEFLFCPPLSKTLWERRNFSDVNRRDIILPNYAPDGLWQYLRTRYQADYVVIDAKNYKESIKKEEILQIANYLQRSGVGLFALIFTRPEPDPRLLYTLREQWVLYEKLIIVLSDADVQQMLSDKKAGTDPAELIRQKIEDFRLSI
ncbi:hypothetical protein [Streptomyces zaomyceticus]|uniref:hypothetical protein n=1 Tax=Streptomyces zaomyceticus TaxID=68286 RepID=UPI001678B603|nr:hypothetical protein [Streptomyces zaomyceticus]GHG39070.1 hypothetical protein GCM10018791_66320 [Streptomyces zaomyceticus]